jgi:hypothetical protein
VPRRFDFDPRYHHGDCTPRRPGFSTRGGGGLTLVLKQDTWLVHIFPVVVLVPLIQIVRCKRL